MVHTRPTSALVASALALALIGVGVLTACGSGGSSSPVTVTVSATSTASSTTAQAKPKPADPQVVFDQYLHRVEKSRGHGNAIDRKQFKIIDKDTADQYSYAGWPDAAKHARIDSKATSVIADNLAKIVAPKGLETAYRRYVAAWRADALIDSDLAGNLSSQAYLDWNKYDARFNAAQGGIANYRVALIGYAAAHHLKLPTWVHHIGVS